MTQGDTRVYAPGVWTNALKIESTSNGGVADRVKPGGAELPNTVIAEEVDEPCSRCENGHDQAYERQPG